MTRPFHNWLPGIAVMTLLLVPAQTVHAQKNALRQDAVNIVHSAALGLGGQLSKTGEREEQLSLLRDFIHATRFFHNDCGYLFAIDREGMCVAHGTQHYLEGKLMPHTKDVNGYSMARQMIEQADSGGGFLEYFWSKPNAKGLFRKLGYVEAIPGTSFILGTGVYYPK